MFDEQQTDEHNPEPGTPTDWSGVIIGILLLPILLLFMHQGKEDVGLNLCVCLLGVLLGIKVRWALRAHLWFWGVAVVVLAIQFPLVLSIHWPSGWVPGVFFLPIAFASFLITIGAIRLVEKLVTTS
ncbi:MAG TPA: hypothetical protein VHU44_09675 [Acidobacteriaceae bacterium]|nr:hypothetical protein [Acidobacteriaceae bacterium]